MKELYLCRKQIWFDHQKPSVEDTFNKERAEPGSREICRLDVDRGLTELDEPDYVWADKTRPESSMAPLHCFYFKDLFNVCVCVGEGECECAHMCLNVCTHQ